MLCIHVCRYTYILHTHTCYVCMYMYISAHARSVKEMREKLPSAELKKELSESLSFPVDLLKSQMLCLALKGKPFQTFDPVDDVDIDALWQHCMELDQRLQVLNIIKPCISVHFYFVVIKSVMSKNTSIWLICLSV